MSALIPKGFKSELTELTYKNLILHNVGTGDILNDPVILARWNIINKTTPNLRFIVSPVIMSAIAKRDSGVQRVRCAWISSSDNGTTWSTIGFDSTISNTEEVLNLGFNSRFLGAEGQPITDIALAVFNSDGATTGTVRAVTAFSSVFLGNAWDLVRVV